MCQIIHRSSSAASTPSSGFPRCLPLLRRTPSTTPPSLPRLLARARIMRLLSLSHRLVKLLIRAACIQRVRLIAAARCLHLRLWSRLRLGRVKRSVLLRRDVVISTRSRAIVGLRLERLAVLGVFVWESKGGGGVIQSRDGCHASPRSLSEVTNARCHGKYD